MVTRKNKTSIGLAPETMERLRAIIIAIAGHDNLKSSDQAIEMLISYILKFNPSLSSSLVGLPREGE